MLPRVLAVAAFVTLAGCSGAGSSSGSAGILRYGYDFSAQFTNLDPGKSSGDCDAIAIAPIFDTLVRKDAGGNLQPGLATSWQVGTDTLTLKLQPGVKFSDGEAFDAAAVKTGLEHLKKNPTYPDLATVTSIDVIDPLTVRLTMKTTPPIELLYSMTGREGMIVAPNHVGDADKKPVGAGPFVFTSFTPGSALSLRENPNYWAKGTYKFKGIDFSQVAVGPPSVTALKAGSVDFVSLQPSDYNGLKNNPSIGIAVQNTTTYMQFQFRFRKPFDNLKVRQAVEFALNRKQLNDVVQDGLGEVATQTFFKASFGYNKSVAGLYPYNPQKARQLLQASGLPLPIKIQMVIPGGNIASQEDQGAIIQQELNAVGFKVSIKRVLGSDIEAGYYLSGAGDAFSAVRPGEPYPPVQIYDQWGRDQFVAIWSKGERKDLTDLSLRALRATSQQEAARITQQAVKIVTEQALDVPIAFTPQLMGYRTAAVGGTVRGQTGVCDAPDLRGVEVKSS